jgi:cytochrome d ubiquinol oxidase subunit II
VAAFRTRALISGVVTGVAAFAALLVIRSDVPDLYDGLTSGSAAIAVIVSAIAGMVTFTLVWNERFEPARASAAVAVGATIVGWWLASRPDLLPGFTIDDAAAPDATLTALVVSIGIGLFILVPSLFYLYRLVLRGTLDQAYEPLDQRFRPLTASDDQDPE